MPQGGRAPLPQTSWHQGRLSPVNVGQMSAAQRSLALYLCRGSCDYRSTESAAARANDCAAQGTPCMRQPAIQSQAEKEK